MRQKPRFDRGTDLLRRKWPHFPSAVESRHLVDVVNSMTRRGAPRPKPPPSAYGRPRGRVSSGRQRRTAPSINAPAMKRRRASPETPAFGVRHIPRVTSACSSCDTAPINAGDGIAD
jgi:hypothetical protein